MRVITLSRRKLLRALWITGIALAASLGLYLLGRAVTPTGHVEAGRPVLYSPTVRQMERYRHLVQRTLADLQVVDAELVTLLTGAHTDVYAISQAAQAALKCVTRLDQAALITYAPPALTSLQTSQSNTTGAYLQAALLVNQWVGQPTAPNYTTALDALRLARQAWHVLASNPWLATSMLPAPEAVPLSTALPEPSDVDPVWGNTP